MYVRKLQPGDRRCILLAQRNQRISAIHRVYGIHSVTWGEVRYATFGENAAMNARRAEMRALPDLAWHWRATGEKSPDAVILPLNSIAMRFKNEWFSAEQAAKTFPPGANDGLLRDWVSSGLLEQDGQARYRTAFFVLSKEERQRIEPDVRATADIAVQIFRSAYARFAEVYAHSAPAAQQVPMQDVTDMVYHRTYSLAIQKLFARMTDFGFTDEHGALRYTAYAWLP